MDAPKKSPWFLALAVGAVAVGAAAVALATRPAPPPPLRHAAGWTRPIRPHFDHTPVIPASFESPQAVTRACLGCHPDAAAVMKTAHWRWLGDEVEIPGRPGKKLRVGKANLLNNFCIAARGNERSCTKCHIGYGWADDSFDFSKAENIDCLVCHEQTGTYAKGPYGLPTPETDLVAAARSVATPTREACLGCHAFGGGGQGVKHGDLDSSLAHPQEQEDVHLGRLGFLCVDCHQAPGHQLRGRAFSVSVEDAHGVACTDCHTTPEHRDERLEAHLSAVACQTCHIPSFASKVPTKATWDWSKAGDGTRPDDAHTYLRIKGEFTYELDARPDYGWFNGTVGRYLLGDRIDPRQVTVLNPPQGSIGDRTARIWPFKVHHAKQPYDAGHDYLFPPVTGGPGGYWTTFDWDSAFRLGEKASGLPYSGQYGFAPTDMYWPLSHMVAPKERALGCNDCHGAQGRMDWKALGYAGDPIQNGGRR
ncbi:MAG: tetrathionate reductase family octaheme c-type cytochrome [Anaeromyxobacter sp.]